MSDDPATWGVQANGFVCPTVTEVLSRIEKDQKALISPDFDTDPDGINGQNNGIFARQAGRVWDALRALDAAQSREGAEGDLLVQQGKLTGTPRGVPTPTIVTTTCTLTSGTTLESGVDYAHIFDHPELTFTPVANFTATSTGTHSVAFKATVTGPQVVTTGTLTVISTPKTGWTAITNAAPGVPGTDVESEASFRASQEADLTRAGAGTAAALAVDLVYDAATGTGVPGVLGAEVLENDTDFWDSNGLPPHSIEPVIYADGTVVPATLAQAIYEGKAATAGTHGTTEISFVDDTGETRTVYYTPVTQSPVYVTLNLSVGTAYPGDTAAKALLASALQARFGQGESVNYFFVAGAPFDIAGVEEVNSCYIGWGPSPSGTASLTVSSLRTLPTFDSSRIVITSS